MLSDSVRLLAHLNCSGNLLVEEKELFVLLVWIVIMPIDAKRYEWKTNFPFWLKALGGMGLLISLAQLCITKESKNVQ
jgi:hypothetical protein